MARFDVHRAAGSLVLNCQAEVLDYLETRFVVPLVPADGTPCADRLNPVFSVEGEAVVMATQLASAVPTRELGRKVISLSEEHPRIINALDMLISGY